MGRLGIICLVNIYWTLMVGGSGIGIGLPDVEIGRKAVPFMPVVVFLAYDSVDSLERTLTSFEESVLGFRKFHSYVSVDRGGDVDGILTAVEKREWVRDLWIYDRSKDDDDYHLPAPHSSRFYITRHYRSVFQRAFGNDTLYTHAILFEDDFLFAPDVLGYFEATWWLLDADPTLFCISAWNDNGIPRFATNSTILRRTDIFPGLGWMMKRSLWQHQLSKSWPIIATSGWDHWIRLPEQMRGRSCVFPEVSRIFHFWSKGTNVARSEYDKIFSKIVLQQSAVVDYGNLEYLIEEYYQREIAEAVREGKRVRHVAHLPRASTPFKSQSKSLVLLYKREEYYGTVAKRLGIIPQPRGSYKGVTILRDGGTYILLVDVRKCPFLSAEEKLAPASNVTYVAAELNQSCTAACEEKKTTCSSAELEFANDCAKLKEHFPCEGGCGFEVGKDLPAYVSKEADTLLTRGQCLITGGPALNCAASSRFTRRLCACI